jgi:transposase
LTLVYQIDLDVTRLLWVGRERTIESYRGFFTVIGDDLASKIVFVCSDMWEPYLRVIREKCSEALRILDRLSHRQKDSSPARARLVRAACGFAKEWNAWTLPYGRRSCGSR